MSTHKASTSLWRSMVARRPARQPRDRDDGGGLPEPAFVGAGVSARVRGRGRAVTGWGLFASSSVLASASMSVSVRGARSGGGEERSHRCRLWLRGGSSGGERLSLPRGGGRREDLRLLLLERRGAMQAVLGNAALNQLSALLVTAPDQLRGVWERSLGRHSPARPPGCGPAATLMRRGVLRRLGRRAGAVVERSRRPSVRSQRSSPRSRPRCSRSAAWAWLRCAAARLEAGAPVG